jgi:hypothetical protein
MKIEGDTMEEEAFGRGSILCTAPDKKQCVVFKDTQFFIVFSTTFIGTAKSLQIAQLLASPPPPNSLMKTARYQTAMSLPDSGDAFLLITPQSLVEDSIAEMHQRRIEDITRLETALATAKQNNDNSEVVYIEEQLTWQRERIEEEEHETKLIQKFYGSMTQFAMGLELHGQVVRYTSRVDLTADAIWSKMLKKHKDAAPL